MSWDDDNGNIKRSDDEAQRIFKSILKNKKWIIEDVGRDKFKEGRSKADIIYYIRISKFMSYYRVTKRWAKQRLGRERYNSPPVPCAAKPHYAKEDRWQPLFHSVPLQE